jgi:hypothetical protein
MVWQPFVGGRVKINNPDSPAHGMEGTLLFSSEYSGYLVELEAQVDENGRPFIPVVEVQLSWLVKPSVS